MPITKPALALLLASLCVTAPAHADGAVTPPRLIEFVEAPMPAQAEADEVTAGAVELELTIDGDGVVADAHVVAPFGHGLDEAALAAVRRFRFEPARRDGQAVAVRIRYRYTFERRPPPPETATPQPETADDTSNAGAAASGDAADLVATPGPAPAAAAVPGDGDGGDFGATARVREEPRGTTRRTIEKEDLTGTPGTRGDALRVVELLPGVARPPAMSGDIVVRGSAPFDSEVFFEGTQVIRLYHFGGLTSFTNARLLDHIDLYPGNFSVRYGRKIGGIIDVGARDPRSDGLHFVVDSNIIDSSILAETAITPRLSVGIAGRRSTIDLFVEKLLPADTVLAAPVYNDYQLLLTYRPTGSDRVRLMVYGSSDKMALLMKDPPDGDPAARGAFSQETYFHRAQLSWEHRYSPSASHNLQVTAGTIGFLASIGAAASQDITGPELFGRSEWRLRLSRAIAVNAGIDVAMQWLRGSYDGPLPTAEEGDPASNDSTLATAKSGHVAGDWGFFRPAAFVEAELRPADPLTIVAGGRVDYFGDIHATTFDPRANVRYRLNEWTTLKAGVGVFSQPPDYGQAVAGIGNPNLRPARAVHYALGVDQTVSRHVGVGLEGFYKTNRDLVVNAVDGSGLVNDGRGRIYGAEASARVSGSRVGGFLAYTLSRSERSDHGGPWRLFDFDQTHILTVAGSWRIGHGWDVGGAFRLISGNPETPITGSVYNANVDLYTPSYGATNSARNPMFHRLDVRVEKQWHPGRILLATYLDLQNAYNHHNREGTHYNFDFTKRSDIPGLPVIPSLGLRGEM